jgi:PleD family two-component response regulator
MKRTRVNGVPHAAMDSRAAMDPHDAMATHAGVSELAGATQSGAVDSVPYRLQQTLADLGELKRALATSQQESNGARQQFDVFMDTISHLRQKVIRLEQAVVHLRHFAYHNELTGLPNRSLLRDRLNQAIVQAAR